MKHLSFKDTQFILEAIDHLSDILPTLRYATDGASSPHREAFLRSTWRLTEVPR